MILSQIPILSYHKVSENKEFGITTVAPQKFDKQIRYLADKGYQSVTFHDIFNSKQIEKPVIITFDDGYNSVYEYAFPVLKKYGFKAVIFVITDYIGKKCDWEAYKIQKKFEHLNFNELNDLLQNNFEIGSHTRTHPYLPSLNEAQLNFEIAESKLYLENKFGINVISICYPYGKYTKKIVEITRKTGYKTGVTSLSIKSNKYHDFALKRRSVYSYDTIYSLKNKLIQNSFISPFSIIEWISQQGAYAGILKKSFNIS